jgi:uncharacterized protein YegL
MKLRPIATYSVLALLGTGALGLLAFGTLGKRESVATNSASNAFGGGGGYAPSFAEQKAEKSDPKGGARLADEPVATATGMAPPAASAATASDLPAREETLAGGGGVLGKMKRADGELGFGGPGAAAQVQAGPVRAGEWDDNANYREWQRFLSSTSFAGYHKVDVRSRRFLVVRDVDGKPMPRCKVKVGDEKQHEVPFVTTASGRAIFFPYAEDVAGKNFTAVASCQEGNGFAKFSLNDDDDGVVDLHLGVKRAPLPTRPVDIAFVLDTTGSMSEEIAAVKSTIQKVAKSLGTNEIKVRIGLVEYKDKGDEFTKKVYPMSSDLGAFQTKISGLYASGGGDMPEHMTAGLHAALSELQWSQDAVARMAFVIGDAPPHLDYQDDLDYAKEMKTASHQGVQLFTIAASGMDQLGQIVWRQMAAYTGGSEMFVLRGGAGPQSTGGGDPIASCGGTQQQYASGNLDELIVSKIKRELKAIDGDPMRIAGLKTDENAKPCNERVAFMQ